MSRLKFAGDPHVNSAYLKIILSTETCVVLLVLKRTVSIKLIGTKLTITIKEFPYLTYLGFLHIHFVNRKIGSSVS